MTFDVQITNPMTYLCVVDGSGDSSLVICCSLFTMRFCCRISCSFLYLSISAWAGVLSWGLR